jgi:hypothetical protein
MNRFGTYWRYAILGLALVVAALVAPALVVVGVRYGLCIHGEGERQRPSVVSFTLVFLGRCLASLRCGR